MLTRTQGPLHAADEKIILDRLERSGKESLFRLPVGDLVAEMGRSFLGTPYTANTLEEPGDEHLVVNLRTFDCVTFCETSLALARAAKLHASTADAYCAQLRFIRYRSGTINGYPSRLHYFSDWIADNEEKKVVTSLARALGGREDRRQVNFMSSHRDAYPRLAAEVETAEIAAIEKRVSGRPRYFIPTSQVEGILEKLENGDIIAITTSVEGLDVTHTGMAVNEGGTIRLLHAPNVGKQVQITAGSLSDYLKLHAKDTGIMIARPLDPTA
ncbi:MAG TPA: N-acetylmuramoyl-L-alanine amidase-like domain-containing protein [Bacteroidota bacterium]|nr:N-acetylmuramoyl-L-alanine amidase-like domain-containing protein [Bacteroidota bacterium]